MKKMLIGLCIAVLSCSSFAQKDDTTSIDEQQVLFVMLAYKYDGCLQGTVMLAHQQGLLTLPKDMGVYDKLCKDLINWNEFMKLATSKTKDAILSLNNETFIKTANWLTKQAPRARQP